MVPAVERIMSRARTIRSLIMQNVHNADADALNHKVDGRWSVRDTLIHLGNCDEAGARVLGNFLRGEDPPADLNLPTDEWNAKELARFEHLDSAGAVEYFQQARHGLDKVAEQISEDHLLNGRPILQSLSMSVGHENGHRYQIKEALAAVRGDQCGVALNALTYSRQQILPVLELETLAPAALEWRPDPEAWSIKEILIHLAVWDRYKAGVYAAIADGRPAPGRPYPEGELDRWNREQVAALAWLSLAEVIHELGVARGALEEQIKRLTPDQWQHERASHWTMNRRHDLEHLPTIWKRLSGWRKE